MAFCLSGLDAVYLSLHDEEEEETTKGDSMAAPPRDPDVSFQQRIGPIFHYSSTSRQVNNVEYTISVHHGSSSYISFSKDMYCRLRLQ